jgi:putative cell wall-binding protein/predicted small secreted protein
MKRRRRILSASIGLAVTVALTVPSTASGALVFSGSVLLTAMNSTYTMPLISGPYVYVTRENISTGEKDVQVYDRRTSAVPTQLSPADGHDQYYQDAWSSRVVWTSYAEADSEIWYDDIEDATPPVKITNNAVGDFSPAIDGNWIVWARGDIANWSLYWRNIETGATGMVDPDVATVRPQEWDVDRGRVVYWDEKVAGTYGVYLYDLESGGERTLIAMSASTYRPGHIRMHGDRLTWARWLNTAPDDKNVWIADLRAGTTSAVTADAATQQYPAVFNELLVWQDDAGGTEDIRAWWQLDPVHRGVNTAVGDQMYPDVYGHSVVYQWGSGSGSDIFLSTAELSPTRIAGGDRYETAALIAQQRFKKSNVAVLATGADFADALAASSLAGALECPVLLTAKDALPTSVGHALDTLGVTYVYIVGGTSAVGSGVTDTLTAEGIGWQQLGGANRYDTAKKVAYLVIEVMGNADRAWRHEAFFVRGDDFADALAIAPHAYALGVPILLVRTDGVPTETRDTVLNLAINDGYIIGGTAAISADTAADIGDLLGDAAVRWSGSDRYATAITCAEAGVARGWLDYDRVGVATGLNFPDALGGGAASGYQGSPILLTAPSSIPEALDDLLGTNRYGIGGMEVYGGEAVVSPYVFGRLDDYLY